MKDFSVEREEKDTVFIYAKHCFPWVCLLHLHVLWGQFSPTGIHLFWLMVFATHNFLHGQNLAQILIIFCKNKNETISRFFFFFDLPHLDALMLEYCFMAGYYSMQLGDREHLSGQVVPSGASQLMYSSTWKKQS